MKKIGDPISLIKNHQNELGHERVGENHHSIDKENKIISLIKANATEMMHGKPEEITDLEPILANMPQEHAEMVRSMLLNNPYIEGAWMTKYHGKYYLQYASPGTEFNIYSDGVYVSDKPLGPFHLADNNLFSYSPGGFCPGAGHGSTMEYMQGNWWHTSTMRISIIILKEELAFGLVDLTIMVNYFVIKDMVIGLLKFLQNHPKIHGKNQNGCFFHMAKL